MQNRSLLQKSLNSSYVCFLHQQGSFSQIRFPKVPCEFKNECAICFDSTEDDSLAKIDGCQHKFCFQCIDTWSETKRECPLCRKPFSSIEFQGRIIDCEEIDEQGHEFDDLIDIIEYIDENGEVHTISAEAYHEEIEG